MKRVKNILRGAGRQSRSVSDASESDLQWASSGSSAAPESQTPLRTNRSDSLPSAHSSFPSGIKVWHDCPDATVDICFVHGLTGNRDTTWTAHGESEPWPVTLLAPKLTRARLLTYGYDAYVVQKSAVSVNRMIDHAANLLNDLTNDRASSHASSRPAILVAHSLGGLVCKEAFLLSRNNPEPHLRGLFECVVGVIFLGTPHKGSWMADWAKIPASGLGLVKTSNKSLLQILETENQLLESTQLRFLLAVRELRESGRKIDVTCFFEELPFAVVGPVVSKDSATLDGYTSFSVHANHKDMVRFRSTEDDGFKRLLGELVRWESHVRLASSMAQERVVDTPHSRTAAGVADSLTVPCYYIPFPRNKYFVGRDETLKTLRHVFFVQECQRVAVMGLGGVGKTQVALKFAHWVKENKPQYSIFWVPVQSNASFEQAVAEITRRLGIDEEYEDPKEGFRQYLSSLAAGPWLLIVDNADDHDVVLGGSGSPGGIVQYLPASDNGLILFTTRSRAVALSVAGRDVMQLQEMDSHEALSFLRQSLVQKEALQDDVANQLLHELTYLPLAISQAAAYLNRNQVSIAEYLELLHGTEQDLVSLMSREFYDMTRYHGSQNAVATTWIVSFEQIQRSDTHAAELLTFISQIEPKAIPRAILPQFPPELLAQAIGTLCAYTFLVRRGETEMFDMHSLVHLATRIWVKRQGLEKHRAEEATRHLNDTFPPQDYGSRFRWRAYLPHCLRVLQGCEEIGIEEAYALCTKVGFCLIEDGYTKEAVIWFQKVSNWRSCLSEEHADRLLSQNNLARAYQENGQIKEAVALFEVVAVAMKKTIPAMDHPDRLATLNNLAVAYRKNGQIKEAIVLFESIVAIQKTTLAEDHPDRLVSQANLAVAYREIGQVKEAILILESVVAIRKITLAENHPDRLALEHNLAVAYRKNRQIREATVLFESILTIQKITLAEDHPDRLVSQSNLAIAYREAGQVEEAILMLESVVAIRKTTLAENHPDRLASENNLAVFYQDNGQIKEAIILLEPVVAIQKITLTKDHPDRLASQANLATAYQKNGQIEEAILLLESVIQNTALAEDHPDRLASENNLALAYQDNGQMEEAIRLLEHVVAVENRSLPEDHSSRLDSQYWLATAYQDNGQIKEAIALFEQVVAMEKRKLAEDDYPAPSAAEHRLKKAYKQLAATTDTTP